MHKQLSTTVLGLGVVIIFSEKPRLFSKKVWTRLAIFQFQSPLTIYKEARLFDKRASERAREGRI